MDPITSTLFSVVVVDFLGACIGGAIGNRTDYVFCQIMRPVVDRMHQGGPPVNGDMQRAVRKAYLQAALILLDARFAEIGVQPTVADELLKRLGLTSRSQGRNRTKVHPADVDEVAWLERLYAAWHDEQCRLPHAEDVRSTPEAEQQIELLLRPKQGATAQDRTRELRDALKRRLIDELRAQSVATSFPSMRLEIMAWHGWDEPRPRDTAVHRDWFELLCAFFAHEIKTNEGLRAIVQGQLLAQLAVDQMPSLAQAVEMQMEAWGGEVVALLDRIEQLLLTQSAHSEVLQGQGDDILHLVMRLPDIEQQLQRLQAVVHDEHERTRRLMEDRLDLLEAFLRSQQTTDEGSYRLQMELDRLRAEQAAADQLRRRRERERIVGPVPDAIVDHFKDRVSELRVLREQVVNEHKRLVLVSGRGGMGKTTLVAKLLHELSEQPWRAVDGTAAGYNLDSIVYIALRQSEFRSPDKIAELVERTLEPEDATELRSKWQDNTSLADKLEFLFRRTLGVRHCLIVLDNFEDVLDDDNHIADQFVGLRQFVESCLEYDHGGRVIVTSRRPMMLAAGLEARTAGRQAVLLLDEGLPEIEATAVLRELDADNQLGIRDAPIDMLREVVQRCRGIPRTLETLVGTLRQRRTLTLARLLDDQAAVARLVDDPARELYESLTPEAQLVMQALSIYDCPVPTTAVRYLLPGLAVDDALDALVRNLAVTYDRDLFSLHAFDQQYAYHQIPDADDAYARSSFHERAAVYFRELRRPQPEWKSMTDVEPHLQEFHHLVRAGQFNDAALTLTEIDLDYLCVWGYSALILDLRSQLVGHLTEPALEEDNWGSPGRAHLRLGQLDQAIVHLDQALLIARQYNGAHADRWLSNLGIAYSYLTQAETAIAYFQQALELARAIGNRREEGYTLGAMANAYLLIGEIQQASGLYEQALAISKEISNQRNESAWLLGLGNTLVAFGDAQQALQYAKQSLDLAQTIGYTRGQNYASIAIGATYSLLGEHARAIESFEQATRIARKVKDRYGESIGLVGLGNAHNQFGHLAEARLHYQDCLKLDVPATNYKCVIGLGVVNVRDGEVEEARVFFEQGVALCQLLLTKTPHLYEARYHLALAQLGSEQPDQALATYAQASKLCSAKGVLLSALQHVQVLRRMPKPPTGLTEVITILEDALQAR